MFMSARLMIVSVVFFFLEMTELSARSFPESARSRAAVARVKPVLVEALKAKGLSWGDEVFLRIIKEERRLELWMRKKGGEDFQLFRSYKVVGMSGHLGPKLKEGDRQAPEGFYFVKQGQLNPNSSYHLAFNIGYPNAYDRGRGRTGSFIMVHGSRWSIGCFAMTDAKIEEIYALCEAALKAGQPLFRVHVFPFRMTEERMAGGKAEKWDGFWGNLKEGYDWFEEKKVPPNVEVKGGKYVFN